MSKLSDAQSVIYDFDQLMDTEAKVTYIQEHIRYLSMLVHRLRDPRLNALVETLDNATGALSKQLAEIHKEMTSEPAAKAQ